MSAWSLPTVMVIGACFCTLLANADTPISTPETLQPSSAIPEYTMSGHTFRVAATANVCTLVHSIGDSATSNLQLDLEPPCYLLTWHHAPPKGKSDPSISDAEPVGKIGEPMAWRYGSTEVTIALVVLGDSPKPDILSSNLYRLRSRQGIQCAPSLQGIRIRDNAVSLSPARKHVGLFCEDLGVEERDFWLLAHD